MVIDSAGVPFPASDGSLVITSTPTDFGLGFFDRPRYPIALRPENGSVLWEYPANTGTASEDPLVVPGHLFYTSFLTGAERSVTAFNSRSGAIIWRASGDEAEDVEELAPTLILVHDGQVYRADEFPTLKK